MKKNLFLLIFIGFFSSLESRTMSYSEPFVPHNYSTLDAYDQSSIPHSYYQECIDCYSNVTDMQVLSITYQSDQYAVKGILAKPTIIDETTPIIIYLRGGSGESGKVNICTIKDKFYFWVQQGYTIIAPQYRGVDGGKGVDELGGAEIDDVYALFDIIAALPYVDKNRIYIIGHSRGTMMALIALRNLLQVKALAITGAVTNFFSLETLRPDLIPLFNQMIPGMPDTKQEAYTQRSAVCWAHDISVPTLIMHGNADTIIDVSQSYSLSAELEKYNKEYSLIIYDKGEHSLRTYQDQINKTMLEWFEKYQGT